MNRLAMGIMGTFGAIVIEFILIQIMSQLNTLYAFPIQFDFVYIVIPITAIVGLAYAFGGNIFGDSDRGSSGYAPAPTQSYGARRF